MSPTPRSVTGWWRDAVVYQLYIRSFADADGDGTGDIGGVRSRLDHLVDLGVDALWVNPWYPSPQADAGYDVADFRDIDPLYGSLDDADALVARRARRGLKVLLDIVPNHTSSEHAWFRAALAGDAGRPRPLPLPGRSRRARRAAAERLDQQLRRPRVDPDHRRRRHARAVVPPPVRAGAARPGLGQPRGARRVRGRSCGSGSTVASTASASTSPTGWSRRPGSRTSAPAGPAAPRTCTRTSTRTASTTSTGPGARSPTPTTRRGSSWPSRGRRASDRLSLYLRPDELHQAFHFDLLRAPLDARTLQRRDRRRPCTTPRASAPAATWVLSNHDVVRGTRYAPPPRARRRPLGPPALARGAGRPRARPAPGPGRRPADAGAARVRLPLPGRGARPPRGRGPARRPCARTRSASARAQTAAGTAAASRCPGRHRAAVRLRPGGRRRALAAAARRLGGARRWPPRRATPTPPWSSTGARCGCAGSTSSTPARWSGSTPHREPWRSAGALTCWLNTGDQSVALPGGRLLLGSVPGMDDRSLPVDAAAWVDTT